MTDALTISVPPVRNSDRGPVGGYGVRFNGEFLFRNVASIQMAIDGYGAAPVTTVRFQVSRPAIVGLDEAGHFTGAVGYIEDGVTVDCARPVVVDEHSKYVEGADAVFGMTQDGNFLYRVPWFRMGPFSTNEFAWFRFERREQSTDQASRGVQPWNLDVQFLAPFTYEGFMEQDLDATDPVVPAYPAPPSFDPPA